MSDTEKQSEAQGADARHVEAADQVLSSDNNHGQYQQESTEAIVRQLEEHVQNVQRDLCFDMNTDSGQMTVKVYDSKTKELIRQISEEDLLKLQQHLKENKGILIKTKA